MTPLAGRAVITTLLLALCGSYFLIGGAVLALTGGSWFYLLLGAGFLIQAALVWRRDGHVLFVAGAGLVVTALWSLWEVGLDVWGLEVRLAVPALATAWLLLPFIRRRLNAVPSAGPVAIVGLAVAITMMALGARSLSPYRTGAAVTTTPGLAQQDSPGAEWHQPAGSLGADRYSRLDQLTPGNVSRLQLAWTYHTGASRTRGDFEATPLKIGNALYICSSKGVAAVDASSGREIWRYMPPPGQARANDAEASGAGTCRGLSYHDDGPATANMPCARRLFEPTRARIVALDLVSGRPCDDFGKHGVVSTIEGFGQGAAAFVSVTSAPLVLGDRLIVGQSVSDSQYFGEPAGGVRAYDVHSGRLLWAWDIGRSPTNKPLMPGEIYTPDTPNAWGPITGDAALGLAYVPTGVTTPDYFGGQRKQFPFDDAYSTAVVALDVTTGLERWHFQTVHHDLWDMDVPTGPSLINLLSRAGVVVPALVQSTKLGELFVLDRRTGEPIYLVREKPAPQGDVPGEYYAPTQPYVTGAQSLRAADIREADSWGATLFDQMLCRIQFRRLDYRGPFSPPSLRGTLVFPGYFGISDWSGVAVDPTRQIAIQNRSFMPWTARLFRRADAEAQGWVKPWNGKGSIPKRGDPTIRPQYFTPYVLRLQPWIGPFGVPCKAPPFGELAGYDLRNGKILWKEIFGDSRHNAPFGLNENLPLPSGIYSVGGALVTASGLTFIAATMDRQFRAFDTATGRELWHSELPFGGHASPMTYLDRDGRQYVVIAAGGNWGMRDAVGDALVAFRLK